MPSLSSVYFSPLTSAEALGASYISPVPAWTYSQILVVEQERKYRNNLTENLLGQLKKRKSHRPLNPKPIGLCRMLFLVLQKDRREGLPGSHSVWHFIRFEHWPSCSFRWRLDRRLCVLHWSFLWISHWRRVDTICEIFQMGAHTVCSHEGRFCLWAFSGINIVLFLVCILWICSFLNSATILCDFYVIHLPKLGTRVRLIRGYEAFKETNFTHFFLFLIYYVCVTTVSSLNI